MDTWEKMGLVAGDGKVEMVKLEFQDQEMRLCWRRTVCMRSLDLRQWNKIEAGLATGLVVQNEILKIRLLGRSPRFR